MTWSATSTAFREGGDDIIGLGDFGIGTDTTEKLRSQWQEQRKQLLLARNFASDVRQIERQDYDPVKSAWGDGDTPGFGESALYDIPGAAAMVGLASVPYAGQALLYSSMEGHSYDLLRDQLCRTGMSDELASAYADNWSGALAVSLTALGSLRAESALSRVPFLEKLLPQIGDYFESAAARTAMRLTVWNGEQAGIQLVQGQLPYVMQDLGSAFSQAIPGVQWSNGKDGPLDGLWTKAGQSVITMLPFSLLTGIRGMQRDASSRGFAEKPPLKRSAYGFTEEANADIDAAAAKGQSSLNEAVDRALETRDPNSDTAKAALAELDAQQAANSSQEDTGQNPVIRRTDDSYTVYDSKTGEVIGTAADEGGAVKLAQSHFEAARFAEAQEAGEAPKLVTTEEGTVALHPETGEPLGPPGTVEEAYRQAKGYVEEERANREREPAQEGEEAKAPATDHGFAYDAEEEAGTVRSSFKGADDEARSRFEKAFGKTADLFARTKRAMSLDLPEKADIWTAGNNRGKFRDGLAGLLDKFRGKEQDRTVIGEFGAENIRKLLGSGGLDPEKLLTWVREAEQNSGRKFLPEDFERLPPSGQHQALENAMGEMTWRHVTGSGLAMEQIPAAMKDFFAHGKAVVQAALRHQSFPQESSLAEVLRMRRTEKAKRATDRYLKQIADLRQSAAGVYLEPYDPAAPNARPPTAAERIMARSKLEIGIGYDENHRLIGEQTLYLVDKTSVEKYLKEGATTAHNHPSSSPPSTEDLKTAFGKPLCIERILMAGKRGGITVYEFMVDPNSKFPGWRSGEGEQEWKEFATRLESLHETYLNKMGYGHADYLAALALIKARSKGTLQLKITDYP